MYTAKIKNKTIENGMILVEIEFTNGSNTFTESIKPMDFDNMLAIIRSRIHALNSVPEIEAHAIGEIIDINIAKEQVEIDRDTWLKQYSTWVKVKTNLIDTNILIGNEPAVVALQTKVKNGFKAGYIDYL